MDAAHWHQGLGLVKPMEEMLMAANPNPSPSPSPNQNPLPSASSASGSLRVGAPAASSGSTERRTRPQKEKSLNCPRCNSTNTKFCYYNNYSLQQPRYFCKTCRRYWTEGGSLRNVPVGGGSRKNKRSSSAAASTVAASSSAAMSGASLTSAAPAGAPAKNPKLGHEGARDLNLAFPHHGGLQPHEFAAFPSLESSSVCNPGAAMASNGGGREGGVVVGALSAMELLRSTGCYMPLPVPMGMPAEYAAAGFGLAEFRAQAPHAQGSLGFSLDVHGTGGGAGGYGATAGLHRVQEGAGRLLFPFEDLKPVVSSGGGASSGRDQFGHSKEQAGGGGSAGAHNTPGFWNGMIGGGGGDSSW